MFEEERRLGSNAILFFIIFTVIRDGLVAIAYTRKYLTLNAYTGDISTATSTLQSAFLDGTDMMLNIALPIPFVTISTSPAGIYLDAVTVLISIISLGIAYAVYRIRKRSQSDGYYI